MATLSRPAAPANRSSSQHRGAARRLAPLPPLANRSLLHRVLGVLMLWQARAEERHALAEMDERILRDIGVDRAAARHEAAKPFWLR